MASLSTVFTCFLVLFSLILARRLFGTSRSSSELPGPPRLPVIGNRMPSSDLWKAFAAYGKEYGSIFSLKVLFTNIVVVNTVATAKELLESRPNIYSGRKPSKMAELCGMCEAVLFQQDPARLRQGRKFIASGLQPGPIKQFQSVLQKHQVAFLSRLLQGSRDLFASILTLPTGVGSEVAYGYQIKGEDDPFIRRAKAAIDHFAQASALSKGCFTVNILPFLAYLPTFLPGMSFRRLAEDWKKYDYDAAEDAFKMVKDGMAAGTARPSLLLRALEDKEGQYEDIVLATTALQLFSGGTDTTSSAIKTFFLVMTLYPDVQVKAQAEIDHHMNTKGAGRLPNYVQDKDDLPYTFAVLREMFRWHGPVPGYSRRLTQDDVYNGHVVKKGTVVLINVWGMLHDETIFPDHETFRPERWLDGEILKQLGADPIDLNFGLGRRICPGRYLAIDLVFSTMASTLALFNISKAKDANGNEITPKEEYTSTAVISPIPFECDVKPRSDATRQLIQDAASVLA